MSRVRTLLAAVLAISCSSLTVPAPSPKAPNLTPRDTATTAAANVALDATVMLLDESARYVTCAGTYLTPHSVITAHHCIDELPVSDGYRRGYLLTHAQWVSGDLEPHEFLVLAEDKSNDLALLGTAHQGTPPPLGERPKRGAAVESIGHPLHEYYTVAAGWVTVERRNTSGIDTIAALISVNFGSSGGGLFDSEWRLVGVTSMMNNGGSIGYFVPIEKYRSMVESLNHE